MMLLGVQRKLVMDHRMVLGYIHAKSSAIQGLRFWVYGNKLKKNASERLENINDKSIATSVSSTKTLLSLKPQNPNPRS